ncbi:MAG: (d)CMP kinase [bacterium]
MSDTPATTHDGRRFSGVVALDGPSGSGKSTVARALARALGARYLDTGAMYRAATAAVLRAGIDPSDSQAVADVVASAGIDISTNPDHTPVGVDGVDVTAEIRGPEVTAAVSAVSAVPEVRAQMVTRQRKLIGAGGIVVEGRDIASVVWPQAQLKVYLTASDEVRAARRAAELSGGSPVDDARAEVVRAELHRRDTLDRTRAASPAVRPDGSVELDTSGLDVAGVVAELLRLVRVGG